MTSQDDATRVAMQPIWNIARPMPASIVDASDPFIKLTRSGRSFSCGLFATNKQQHLLRGRCLHRMWCGCSLAISLSHSLSLSISRFLSRFLSCSLVLYLYLSRERETKKERQREREKRENEKEREREHVREREIERARDRE